ncbi:MAG: GxxExxY protein [Chitinophagaceae bacterium]|nr:GxxExxY protein [Chitinophagaceae bacterium]
MHENELSKIILDTAFSIHKELGPGLLESVYEEVMFYELRNEHGLFVQRQELIPVVWRNVRMEYGFRADLIVENEVLVELKSVETLTAVHPKQVLTYLKLTGLKLGMLLNFNEAILKNGIRRIVNNL